MKLTATLYWIGVPLKRPAIFVLRVFVVLLATGLLAAGWRQRATAQTGYTYVEPEVRRSRNGVLDITLDMRLARNTVAGRTIETATYGGTIPGPTMRVKPGDLLKIKLVNNLTLPGAPLPNQTVVGVNDVYARSIAMMRNMGVVHTAEEGGHTSAADPLAQLFSNIHTHGLQVTAAGNADNPFLIFKPGETFNYEIQIPPDQPAGITRTSTAAPQNRRGPAWPA